MNMDYSTTINDEAVDFGITAARLDYNASLRQEVLTQVPDEEGNLVDVFVPNPELIQTNEAYLDFVLGNVVQSWCQQFARGRELPAVVVRPAIAGG